MGRYRLWKRGPSTAAGCATTRISGGYSNFLADVNVKETLEQALSRLVIDGVGETDVVLIYPFSRGRFTTPELLLPQTDIVFLFALLLTISEDTPTLLKAMRNRHCQIREQIRATGGTTYLDEIVNSH